MSICIFNHEKKQFCTLCLCISYFLVHFAAFSLSINDLKWPVHVLKFYRERAGFKTLLNFCFVLFYFVYLFFFVQNLRYEFRSSTIRTYFTRIIVLNSEK